MWSAIPLISQNDFCDDDVPRQHSRSMREKTIYSGAAGDHIRPLCQLSRLDINRRKTAEPKQEFNLY
jgi:hypothetical protein